MGQLVLVGGFILFWVSLMFRSTLTVWAYLLILMFHAIKWLVILGLLAAFLNMPQVYSYVGWTPVSILFGNHVYDRSLRELDLRDPHKNR